MPFSVQMDAILLNIYLGFRLLGHSMHMFLIFSKIFTLAGYWVILNNYCLFRRILLHCDDF